jgi:hypothetical protein
MARGWRDAREKSEPQFGQTAGFERDQERIRLIRARDREQISSVLPGPPARPPKPLPRVVRFGRMACRLFLDWRLCSQLGRGGWVMRREGFPPTCHNRQARSFAASDDHVTAAGQLPQRVVAGLQGGIDRVEWIDTCESRGFCQHGKSNMLALNLRGYAPDTHLVVRVAALTIS